MDQPKQSEKEIIELGKLLVNELSLDDSGDTLSRWMAHYLSDRMTAYAEMSEGNERNLLGQEIANLVIKLWDRNKIFQHSTDPLLNLKNAIRNLNSLQKPNKRKHFFEHPLFNYAQGKKDFPDFIEDLKKTYLDVANAIIIASLLPDHLKKSTKWRKDFDSILSTEEKNVIDELKNYLEDYKTNQIVFVNAGDTDQVQNDESEFLDYVLATIEKRLAKMLNDFQSLRAKI